MSEPSYLGGETTGRSTDTRLLRWTRILGALQNLPGAHLANNSEPADTLLILKQKAMCSARDVAYSAEYARTSNAMTLRSLLDALGGSSRSTDTQAVTERKILDAVGGTSKSTDTLAFTERKIIEAL